MEGIGDEQLFSREIGSIDVGLFEELLDSRIVILKFNKDILQSLYFY